MGVFDVFLIVQMVTFQQVDVYLNEPIKIYELMKSANQSN